MTHWITPARLAGLALLLAVGSAAAQDCRGTCMKERGYKRRQLDACLAETAKAPAGASAKARLDCRHRAVIPDCSAAPPCADGQDGTVGIDIVAHYFSRAEDGAPLDNAVFRPGDTVHFRYQGLLSPDPAGTEVALDGDVALKDGKRVIERQPKNVQVRKRLVGADRDRPHKFGGRASFKLPANLRPGEYAIEIRLREAKSGIEATRGYRFKVADHSPPGDYPQVEEGLK